jgi:hypothetical protein
MNAGQVPQRADLALFQAHTFTSASQNMAMKHVAAPGQL